MEAALSVGMVDVSSKVLNSKVMLPSLMFSECDVPGFMWLKNFRLLIVFGFVVEFVALEVFDAELDIKTWESKLYIHILRSPVVTA